MTRTLIVLATLTLAGCAGPPCLQDQPYRSAELYPGLDAPPGLNVPKPDPKMRVPDVASGPVGTYPGTKGMTPARMRCLAMPRRFEPSAQG